MTKSGKVTIKDVAADAGVSVGTVSRVLAKTAEVKQPLQERVRKSIEKLGYKPNAAARALRANRASVIGLMVPNITNPFFSQIADCLESEASKRGYAILLASSQDNLETEARQFSALLDHHLQGVVLIPARDHLAFSPPDDLRLVVMDRPLDGRPAVSLDQRKSAALAADHLVNLGHKRIAYIAGPSDIHAAKEREQGFSDYISHHNQSGSPVELSIFHGSFDYTSGEDIARHILLLPEHQKPTAIAAASDQQAIGAMRAARDMDVAVPDELSIIGFDDIALADLMVPRLTTIRQPIKTMVLDALEQIISPDPMQRANSYTASLVPRRSTSSI